MFVGLLSFLKSINATLNPLQSEFAYICNYFSINLGESFQESLFITEYSLSDNNLQGADLLPLKFPLYNRIFS